MLEHRHFLAPCPIERDAGLGQVPYSAGRVASTAFLSYYLDSATKLGGIVDAADKLLVPDAVDDEAQAAPFVQKVANTIGALAAADGLVAPTRLETAISVSVAVGDILGQPSLTRALTVRALSAPPPAPAALASLKSVASSVSPTDRASIMRELMRLIDGNVKPGAAGLGSDLAAALSVPLPDQFRHDGRGILDTIGQFADRAKRLVRPEAPILANARDFAIEFSEVQLLDAVMEAQRTGDHSILIRAIRLAVDTVRERADAVSRTAQDYSEPLSVAQDLEKAADQIERIAQARYAAITRRARMLKRHIREDLNALAEDAAEEFETDFRRSTEKTKKWFGKLDTTDLNDRLAIKNLERRYRNLAQRYQDQLDLLDREVAEFCDEFTRISDEALRPIARHEFRKVVPHPSLRLRVKSAADRVSNRTLATGTAGAVASGAAVHAGILTAGAVIGAAATPAGVVVLGAVALAGVWKMFSAPRERQKRDLRERTRTLEDGLRHEIMSNLPRFEDAVDAIVGRFREAAVPDIARPRIEAERIREIASAHRTLARGVTDATNARITRLVGLIDGSELTKDPTTEVKLPPTT